MEKKEETSAVEGNNNALLWELVPQEKKCGQLY